MDVRSIQKTGNMYYMYLPSSWCKKHKIVSQSKVIVNEDNQGILTVSARIEDKKAKDIEINLKEDNLDVIQKVIMGCYVNPTNSFTINLEKKMDVAKLLQQRKLISLALVECCENTISCESNVSIENPLSLLITMLKKTRNLIYLMIENYDSELINRYEEEIDESKILIEKSVIASFTYHKVPKLKTIEIYYISQISKDLERFVDHLIQLTPSESKILNVLIKIIDKLKEIIVSLKNPDTNLNNGTCVDFVHMLKSIPDINVDDSKKYNVHRIKGTLTGISEVLMDWSVTQRLEESR
ncbi:hypothetical protein JW930_07250 [Candidatus Woesearchaeota archaeon]|nr:hypothetical protein [Candidatus Woesearchaeota archaeon]